MKLLRFLLSTDECELLVAFEKEGNIDRTATLIGKDPSVVSRQLSNIARKYPALEKRHGRWALTQTGKALNSLTRNLIQAQKKLSENRPTLTIGTNREFGARVIGPNFASLQAAFPNTQLVISTFEAGTEDALLKGQIDVGLDCERPFDPVIAYKLVVKESILAVCTKNFRKKYEKEISAQKLYQIPHLLCERLYPDKIFSERENQMQIAAQFNDIATTRAACLAHAGWGLLPKYAIREELDSGKLIPIEGKSQGESRYGIWWSRTRQLPTDVIDNLEGWLRQRDL